MRFLWASFCVSIPLYIYAGRLVGASGSLRFPNAEKILVVLGALSLLSFFWFWKKQYLPALDDLRNQPENIRAIQRWRTYWTILACVANSVAVLGLIFGWQARHCNKACRFSWLGFFCFSCCGRARLVDFRFFFAYTFPR